MIIPPLWLGIRSLMGYKMYLRSADWFAVGISSSTI